MSAAPMTSEDLDLTRPLALDLIPETGFLVGQVGEERVMVARTADGGISALTASCSHYGGPLHQGLRRGDTVICPLHHACFDLRTGQPLRAPALAPVTLWEAEVTGGDFRLIGPAPQRVGPAAVHDGWRIVIVGGGAAGFACAQRLRALGFAGEVVLLSQDDRAPYDRPNVSKDYLSGEAPIDWMPLKPPEWYVDNRVQLHTGVEVETVDPVARDVRLADGRTFSYDRLLLATGSASNRILGEDFARDNVHTLRSMADCERLIASIGPGERAVVIGSSFIGLEAATSLRKRGLEVTVVGSEAAPLASKVGPALADVVRAAHEGNGVSFRLGRSVRGFDGRTVILDDGEQVETDHLILGIGVTPRLELARAMGLDIDRGVLVDGAMRTSAPDVFAAGDIARYPDPWSGDRIRIEHWVVAERQGQIAAAAMLGLDLVLNEAPFFWSKHPGMVLQYVGHAEAWDQTEVLGNPGEHDAEVRLSRDGRLAAVIALNRRAAALQAVVLLQGGADLLEGASPDAIRVS